jgi:GalNAc-alpha-(1->4)-GalNAc-alpha-(1->3)-diNAcBac-PP-undecaprenol alpha-1,4-N-acetyl-D-galactosaminyltransferase
MIYVVVGSLRLGGAEKAGVALSELLQAAGYETTLVSINDVKEFSPKQAKVVTIGLVRPQSGHVLIDELPLLRTLFFKMRQAQGILKFRALLKNDTSNSTVISYGAVTVVWSWFASFCLKRIKRIGFERISPDSTVFNHGFFTSLLRPYVYRHGTRCLVQNSGQANWVRENWGLEPLIVPNHLAVEEIRTNSLSKLSPGRYQSRYVIWIGRSHAQKNIPLLLQIMREARDRNLGINFMVLGIPADDPISAEIIRSGALVIGRVTDIRPFLRKCSLVLSTSLYEGFPNAVLEGLHYGLPAVVTSSSSIISEWATTEAVRIFDKASPAEAVQYLADFLSDFDEYVAASHNAHLLSRPYLQGSLLNRWKAVLKENLPMQ